MAKNQIKGWIAALLVTAIWGVTGVVSKPLSMAVDSMTLVFFRYVTAFIGLFVIFLITHKNSNWNKELGTSLKIDKKDILLIAFTGIVGQGCFSLFNFLSLAHIGATENQIIQGMQPFATVVFGIIFMGYKMSKIQWIAFLVSALCIYTLSTGDINQIEGGIPWLGFLYVTLSMLSLAWTAYLRDKLANKYGSVVAMFYQYIAVAVAGIVAVIALDLDLSQIKIIFDSPLLLSLLIFLGMGISGGSYLVQLYAFKHIGVENASMALNLMPLVGYVVAVLTLGESFSITITAIISVIVVALYFFTRFTPKEA